MKCLNKSCWTWQAFLHLLTYKLDFPILQVSVDLNIWHQIQFDTVYDLEVNGLDRPTDKQQSDPIRVPFLELRTSKGKNGLTTKNHHHSNLSHRDAARRVAVIVDLISIDLSSIR